MRGFNAYYKKKENKKILFLSGNIKKYLYFFIIFFSFILFTFILFYGIAPHTFVHLHCFMRCIAFAMHTQCKRIASALHKYMRCIIYFMQLNRLIVLVFLAFLLFVFQYQIWKLYCYRKETV